MNMETTEMITELATEIVTDYHEQLQQTFKESLYSKEGLYGGFLEGIKIFFSPQVLPYILGIIAISVVFKILDNKVLKKKKERQKQERIKEMKELMEAMKK